MMAKLTVVINLQNRDACESIKYSLKQSERAQIHRFTNTDTSYVWSFTKQVFKKHDYFY